MSRLIAFGCSITYGHALSDCYIPPYSAGYEPSKLAYPQLVADNLNLECINTSHSGSSNKDIWHKVVTFEFQPDDVILLQWTYPDRTAIINDDNTVTSLASWQDDELSKNYYKNFHTNTGTNIDFYMMFNHVNFMLNKKVLSVTNIKPNNNIYNNPPGWNEFSFVDLYIDAMSKEHNSIALDGVHPGELAHEQLAKGLMKKDLI